MSGTHLEEGEIHAWLDAALSAVDAERVESHIADCGTCREAVAEARGFIAASSRILSALDAVPSGVIPATPRGRARGGMQRIAAWPVSAIAAAVVVAVGVVVVARREPTRDATPAPAAVPRTPVTTPVPPSTPSIAPAAAVPAPPNSRAATSHPTGPRAASAQAVPPMEERAVAMPAAPAPMPVPAPSVAAGATDAAVSAKAVPKGTVGGTGPVANMQSIRLMRISPAAAGAHGSAGAARLIWPGCDSAVRKTAADSSSVSPSIPMDSTAARDSVARRDSIIRARRCP